MNSLLPVLQTEKDELQKNGNLKYLHFPFVQHIRGMHSFCIDRTPYLSACNTHFPRHKNAIPGNFLWVPLFYNDKPSCPGHQNSIADVCCNVLSHIEQIRGFAF